VSCDVVVRKSRIQGKGLFAARDFKKGEVVLRWNLAHILTVVEVAALPPPEQKYVSVFENGTFILFQSPERYVNHSCEPNTQAKERCDVALRNIHSGEEITTDYTGNAILPSPLRCRCGSKRCRKLISGIKI
jgi:SET domain-containing protein